MVVDDIGRFRDALIRFYEESQRDFPWRRTREPYGVLVSEVMLQQTRALTVVPYFERWMERFPGVAELAAADEQEVLRHWQGLGYYARARNLHATAREVLARFEGVIPADPDVLRTLPGIGAYTAGAIASIAYGVPAPAVDGNARRVLSRLMDHPDPTPSTLRSWAARLVDPIDPGGFNQAMMELGSQICTPKKPHCIVCPVAEYCRAKRSGTQERRPVRRSRRAVPQVTEALAAVVQDDDGGRRVLLRRRPRAGLLGGMWEVPGAGVEATEAPAEVALAVALAVLAPSVEPAVADGDTGRTPGTRVDLDPPRRLEPVDHAFTHFRVCYRPFIFRARPDGRRFFGPGNLRWVDQAEAEDLPISTAQLRVLEQVFELIPQPVLDGLDDPAGSRPLNLET